MLVNEIPVISGLRRRLTPKILLFVVACLFVCMEIITRNMNSLNTIDDIKSGGRNLMEVRPVMRKADGGVIPRMKSSNSEPPVATAISTIASWFASSSSANRADTSLPIQPNKPQGKINVIAPTQDAHSSGNSVNNINSFYNSTSQKPGTFGPSQLTREQCKAKYGERKYLPLNKKKLPPMLYTFPGAGNTWCRLLIEYGTGIYTGSVYNDKTLLNSLPGEFTCNWQVSVIKIHPHTHPFEGLRTGHFHSDATKCKRGQVDKIRRAIMVLRDPFDSIWSEFQRRITQSHVGGVMKANFDWHRWQANAAALAHQYYLMWAVQHTGIEAAFSEKDYLYIRYEDLKNKDTRVETLKKVADFLSISPSDYDQLACAFALADKRDTHRTVDKSLTMTKEEAYTVPLACRMWALFGAHASQHGYKMWKDIDCTKNPNSPDGGYKPIPQIRVGSQGEYDKKWVKPGAALVDFGGWPGASNGGRAANNNNNNNGGSNGGNNGGNSGGVAAHDIAQAIAASKIIQPPAIPATPASMHDAPTSVDPFASVPIAPIQHGAAKVDIDALSVAARKEFRQQQREKKKQNSGGGGGRSSLMKVKSAENNGFKSVSGGKRGGGGMSMQQAGQKDSVISAVGADKPAWQ